MNQIKEYKAVRSDSSDALNQKINEMIAAGWQPLYGVSVAVLPMSNSSTVIKAYAQAMVRYADSFGSQP